MEVRPLKPAEWAAVIPVFDKVFDSDVPPPEFGKFIGVFEDGKLEAFIMLEQVMMIDQVWSRQSKNNAQYLRKLVNYVRETVPDNQTVATCSDGKKHEILFKLLGFKQDPGHFFRRNAK